MDPRYRALLVMSSFLTFLWAAHVLWTVFLGSGINLPVYTQGVTILLCSVAAGFATVWGVVILGNVRRSLKTGFEATVTDEFGTVFEMASPTGGTMPFKLSLSKFLPQMIAPPDWPGLHPLEAELIGFLQGYRHWPIDLNKQNPRQQEGTGKEFVSLYEQSIARWQVMRHIPGSGPLHRIAALSKDLALVHAYAEKRTTHSLWNVFKRDEVKHVLRCQPHGGMTAFVLSTFPAFRDMKNTREGQDIQRAILVAMRYHATPTMMPINGGPLARELVDYLWRADAQLQQMDVREVDEVSPEQLEDLAQNTREQWLGVLSELAPQSQFGPEISSLKLPDGSVWVRQDILLANLAATLRPSLRQAFNLWDTSANLHHTAWPHLVNVLLENRLIAASHDDQAASNGCFMLSLHGATWGPVLKLALQPELHGAVVRTWAALPALADTPDVIMDNQQLAARAQGLSGNVDAKLTELF